MIKTIIRTLCMAVLCIFVIGLGGYTVESAANEIHLKDPETVFSPLINQLPDMPTETELADKLPTYEKEDSIFTDDNSDNIDTSNGELQDPGGPFGNNDDSSNNTNEYIDENGNMTKADIKAAAEITHINSIKISIDGKEAEITTANTFKLAGWIKTNWKDNSKVTYKVVTNETTDTTDVSYNEVLQNKEDLDVMVKSISVVDSLPDLSDYDRTEFEKPVKSYKMGNETVNRNDYAWKNSKWFDSTNFTYMCPYTGTIINDGDDKKLDGDFGTLDFDHIVPLRSAYIRGANNWSDKQKNEYAYDQWVGVDVLNSANRSKADKGPCEYLPEINIADYCYSWLAICSKYELVMTQDEIDLCVDNITIALDNGEEVALLGYSSED